MNVKDLRDSLIQSFQDLKTGKLKTKEAKELTNLAGKIILSAKTELDYNKYTKNGREIEFLDVPQAMKLRGHSESTDDVISKPRKGRPTSK